jgi:aminoglycoside phosphotransferase (APT) family kinase protein
VTAFPDGPEIALPAGDVTVGVVRIGTTVRRPQSAASSFVAAYLDHLASVGFDRAPRYLGQDDRGRDVLTYLDGDVPGAPVEQWAAADEVLPGVGRLLRALHDASEGFRPPPREREPGRPVPRFPAGEPQLVAHRDVTPQNTVFRAAVAWGVIDFDLSDWTTRSLDLANTAMHWVPLDAPEDRPDVYRSAGPVGDRLRRLLDAYGRDAVGADGLLDACELRFAGAYVSMKWAAENLGGGWARMWDEGVGERIQRRISWFAGARAELAAALR